MISGFRNQRISLRRQIKDYPSEVDDGPKKKLGNNQDKESASKVICEKESKEEVGRKREVSLFTKTDKGPFKVIVSIRKEFINSETPPPSIIAVGRDLVKKYNLKFENITRKSKYAWNVLFSDRVQANNAIKNDFLNKDNCPFRIELPWYLLCRKFIIKKIPVDIDDDELTREIQNQNPNIKVEEIYRFQKRNYVDGKTLLTKTTTVKVTIRGQSIPSDVILWHFKVPAEIFTPNIRRCFRCGQLSHSSKFCKNRSKCLRCGDDYDASTKFARYRLNVLTVVEITPP